MPKLYFTREGAKRIRQQKHDLREKLRSTQNQKGEAAEVGGNQWHDNFSFEQLSRDEQMINKQITEINEKIGQMVVIDEPPRDTNRLRIGHRATLEIDGEKKTYLVGGYEDSNTESNPPVISYLAPLISQFIGKEEGDTAQVLTIGERKTVTLVEIKFPEPI